VSIYSDALTEASDPAGQMLGEPGLLAVARGLAPCDPLRVGPALLDGVARHRAGRPAQRALSRRAGRAASDAARRVAAIDARGHDHACCRLYWLGSGLSQGVSVVGRRLS
jgi:hypothetical protein